MHLINLLRELCDLPLSIVLLVRLVSSGILIFVSKVLESLSEASDLVLKRLVVPLLGPSHDEFFHQVLNFLVHGCVIFLI